MLLRAVTLWNVLPHLYYQKAGGWVILTFPSMIWRTFRDSHLLLMPFVFQRKKKVGIEALLISLEPRSQQHLESTPSFGGCTGRGPEPHGPPTFPVCTCALA